MFIQSTVEVDARFWCSVTHSLIPLAVELCINCYEDYNQSLCQIPKFKIVGLCA